MGSNELMAKGAARVATHRRERARWLVLVLVVAGSYMTLTGDSFLLFVYNSCLLACLGAIALNLLTGTAGLLSIGNAAFLAVGGFSGVWFEAVGVPFPLNVVLAALFGGVVGVLFGLPALRLKGLYLALSTLAAHFIVLFVAGRYQTAETGEGGFPVERLFASKGLTGEQRYWTLLLTVLLVVWVLIAVRLGAGRVARAWRTLRDHEEVAPSLGINVTHYKLMAFVLSSVVVSLQGALAGHFVGTVSVDSYTLVLAFSYLAMILIGGVDSVAGAVIGAFLVTSLPLMLPRWLNALADDSAIAADSPHYARILFGVLIIVFVTSSPKGIVGWSRSVSNSFRSRWRTGSGAGGSATLPMPATTETHPLDTGKIDEDQSPLA